MLMPQLPLTSYDCFSDRAYGGSVAMMVSDAAGLDEAAMRTIAREMAAPATCFIQSIEGDAVHVRFFSASAELPMCGHGTVGLFTKLFEDGLLVWGEANKRSATLTTPIRSSPVDLFRSEDGRPRVMLDMRLPAFELPAVDVDELAGLLGVGADAFDPALPLESASADFVHLVVAMRSQADLHTLQPDFMGLSAFCRAHGFGTVIAFTSETGDPEAAWRCRDFCPAVGVDEAPAVGTSNGALACYLVRHGVLAPDTNGCINVFAEQGYSLGRPSRIDVAMSVAHGEVAAVRVGGMATRVISGFIRVPL